MINDIQQFTLNPDLTITENKHKFAEKQDTVKYDDVVLCPFCLKSNILGNFFLRKGLRICPNCTSQMKLSTLSKISDLDKFVDFVYGYRLNGFWNKICLDVKPVTHNTRFNEWNKRLKELGLSRDFWDRYKALKGDFSEENE